jgi:hypothetical protein
MGEQHEGARAPIELSDEQIDAIADKAAEKAYKKATDHIYLEIGKATARAALLLVGAGLLALATWLGIDTTKIGR